MTHIRSQPVSSTRTGTWPWLLLPPTKTTLQLCERQGRLRTSLSAVQAAESHWTVWWSRFQTVRTSASGLHRRGESVVDTSDWYSGWSRSPPNSNLRAGRASRTREQQEGWAEDTCDFTVTRQSGVQRSAATTGAKPDRRGRWRWSSRVGRCR